MKKLFTILTAAICLNANAQTINAFARNGLAAPDSSGTGLDSIIIGPNGQCFSNAANYPDTANPHSAISADFNNDGFQDLVATNYGADHISIFLGTGTGTFGAATSFSVCAYPFNPSNFSSVCSADFNTDGFKDLAVAIVDNNSLYILLGTGTGSFGAATNFAVGTHPYSVISADFNGDGKADLATANYGSNNVSILFGVGTGSFSVTTNFTVGTNPQSVISADFNLDGKPDLAVANAGSNNISVLLGTGTGSFTPGVNFPTVSDPMSITSADFNNDSRLDLAATDGADSICVLLGTGTGSFGAPMKHFTSGLGFPYQGSIVSADFNMDGNADLATSDYAAGSGYASVFLGTGTGSFGAAGNFATGSNPWTIVAADFNMDGKPDLATPNSSNHNISILLNTPTHTISIATTVTTLCPGSSTTLTASGSTTYSWSTNATTSSISVAPTVNTTYNVTDGVGCSNAASITINVATTSKPNICMVTTDSASAYKYNVVYWDKTPYINVDSFIIYRNVSSNYLRIGAVSKNALSEFIDTSFSIGGPNGGNPQYSSWQYKLAIRDTCGNIGAKSPYHQSMFVQESGSNFSWNAYTVEAGQVNPITGYSFLRDNNNMGNWNILVNTNGLSTTDPNYSSYPNGNWRIDALGFNCTPTMRFANSLQNTYSKSHSNTTRPAAVGINQLSLNNDQIKIYPNPATEKFTIETTSAEKQIAQVFEVNGRLMLSQIINNKTIIDATNFAEGIYTLTIKTGEHISYKKLVIVR